MQKSSLFLFCFVFSLEEQSCWGGCHYSTEELPILLPRQFWLVLLFTEVVRGGHVEAK